MRKWLINSFPVLGLFVLNNLIAQERPLGEWQLHPSYRTIIHLTGDSEIAFAASENGLFSLRAGSSPNSLAKTKGLSDQSVGAMEYLSDRNALLIGYKSGIIDLVYQDRVVSDKAIYNLDSRLSKTIYDVATDGEITYFASDLGVIQYDISRGKARDIYRNIGPGATETTCYQVEMIGDSLYAFCDAGLLVGNIHDNLLDFGQWQSRISESFLTGQKAVIAGDYIFYSTANQLVRTLRGTQADTISFSQPIAALSTNGNSLLIASGNQLITYVNGAQTVLYSTSEIITAVSGTVGTNLVGLVGQGVFNVIEEQTYLPSGPARDDYTSITSIADLTFFGYGESSMVKYTKGQWEDASIAGGSQVIKNLEREGKTWVLDRSLGLYDTETKAFIDRPVPDGTFTDFIVIDGRIWVSLESSNTPLAYSDDLISWTTFSQQTLGSSTLGSLASSLGGTLYMLNASGYLIAYDPEENQVRNLTEHQVTDFVIDYLDGLYLATHEGLYVYPDATNIFDGEDARESYISSGDLLQEDDFTSVAIDAGNRKWLATSDGLWLYDANLDNQLAHYTQDNSPLPTNSISDLYFQIDNGLLWVQTNQGLASLQTDAKAGTLFHEKVSVFPSPLYLHEGVSSLGIRGLAIDVTLKITSLSGRYVAEVISNGSMTSWNLMDARGNKVGPGIYLIFSSDPSGVETYVGKFLIEP